MVNEERGMTIGHVLLIRVIVGDKVFEASGIHAFGDAVETLLVVQLSVRGWNICLCSRVSSGMLSM